MQNLQICSESEQEIIGFSVEKRFGRVAKFVFYVYVWWTCFAER